MSRKTRGRPPLKYPTSVRMSKGTQLRLQQMARSMCMTQGRVFELAIQRLYDAEIIEI